MTIAAMESLPVHGMTFGQADTTKIASESDEVRHAANDAFSFLNR
ncbi:MAG TPA: hypothetical protein VGI45_05690 [Terracidiphilus sp.]|jgi:hypothetical protein